ncbi:type II toxin-antitoxin system HicA family toxin [Nitrososphaera sp.]|uniref:type II toxin-antitoxin system HicA family toxin n=1 Tax=Nitrososphaera sp. TaxID=1971748 RepID=UPI0018481F37|nr:type II toxin-antitoxin system HicA family toxin [Nitrososphaera sp.]NWG36301.1 type II toxin-antitoxin system HicA family toxin [Nitrososphaera sp.]
MSLKNHGWREIRALGHFGYVPVRQSGSHIVLKNSKGMAVSVPRRDPLPEGTLRAILLEAEIKKEDFVRKL